MAEGRGKLEWAQTSEILALIANVNRDENRRGTPFKASEWNPFTQHDKERDGIQLDGMDALKEHFETMK